jgi:hypothetical protein
MFLNPERSQIRALGFSLARIVMKESLFLPALGVFLVLVINEEAQR